MRSTFFQYNVRGNGKIDKIMEEGIIVLDTNALLNVYRYSKANRKKYIEVLDAVNDRLFLTYQSVQEFYNNRLSILYNKHKFKADLKTELYGQIKSIENIIRNNNFNSTRKDSCNLLRQEESLKNDIINILNKCEEELIEKIEEYNVDIMDEKCFGESDPILNKILDIFDNRVNKGFTKDELEKIYKEGKKRYELKTPPGYKDVKGKTEPACYGDLVIWKEIIQIAKEKNKDVLFISDDTKEDWCDKFKEYNDLGPRKELIKEFFCETEQYFHSLTCKEFINYISKSYGIGETRELEKESEIVREELINFNKNSNSFREILSDYLVSLGDKVVTRKLSYTPDILSEHIFKEYLNENPERYLNFIKNNINEMKDMEEMEMAYFKQSIISTLNDILSDSDKVIIEKNLSLLSKQDLSEEEQSLAADTIMRIVKNSLEK